MGIAKVTKNYQVTIPKDVRRIHGINVGDTVLFAIEGNKVDFMKKDKALLIRETGGIWKTKGDGVSYVREIRKEWNERAKRLGI